MATRARSRALLNDIFGGGRQGGSAVDSADQPDRARRGRRDGIERDQRLSPAGRLRIRLGARTQPGGSSADSRLSTGGPGGAGGGRRASRAAAADTIASRSGPFGRGGEAGRRRRCIGSFRRAAAAGGGGGQAVLPSVRITADPVNNTLLIYANQENYRVIEQTLRQLDRPQLQVSIDATIAEITLNDNLNYGVQFFLKSQRSRRAADDKGSLVLSNTGSADPEPRAARVQFPARLRRPSRA